MTTDSTDQGKSTDATPANAWRAAVEDAIVSAASQRALFLFKRMAVARVRMVGRAIAIPPLRSYRQAACEELLAMAGTRDESLLYAYFWGCLSGRLVDRIFGEQSEGILTAMAERVVRRVHTPAGGSPDYSGNFAGET